MQEQSSQQNPPIYSQSLKTKSQNYFFDVKAAKNGSKYISISQSWIKDGQGHRGSITIFQSDLQDFSQAMAEAVDKVK